MLIVADGGAGRKTRFGRSIPEEVFVFVAAVEYGWYGANGFGTSAKLL